MKINILISETMMANKPDSIKYSSGTGEFSSDTDVPGWLRVALSVHFTSNYLTIVLLNYFNIDYLTMDGENFKLGLMK